jgi:mRNA interferase YafQ
MTSAFRRDRKRIKNSIYANKLHELEEIVYLLATNQALAAKHCDHYLVGDWHGHRECHIRPDWLLIYKYEGDDELYLFRTGSHAELFD